MMKKKEYIFRNYLSIKQETSVMANSYEEAEDIFLSGGGSTKEVDANGEYWDCIQNADDFEEDQDE
tara:strand:+ start:214 stop:411 length:198 start_codon:yes stop_codon:yes gene_type:complete